MHLMAATNQNKVCCCSGAEAEFEAVIIELFSELVVVFPFKVVDLASRLLLREHRCDISFFSIDLEFVQSLALTSVHVVSGSDESICFLKFVVYVVIGGADVAPFK